MLPQRVAAVKKSENYWQFMRDFGKPAEEAAIYQSRLKKIVSDDLVLYNENSLNVMRKILEKHPNGCFDMIFADPPYFLSNDGFSCQSGQMVSVNKGNWDKSKGMAADLEFYEEWLRLCYALLKPNGTIWVCGTFHNIYLIGYLMQTIGYHILNNITWENPILPLICPAVSLPIQQKQSYGQRKIKKPNTRFIMKL